MIDLVNNNRYFWGVTLLLLNLGSRHIVADIGQFIDNVLKHELTKKIILFSLFFVATRDVITSFIMTIIFTIIVYGVFNEKSKYSLVPDNKIIYQRIREYYQNK